jgi:conjugative relaxase-like TrwC/TraI family protein
VRDLVVTARVITLKGADAGRYYVEEVGRYYLDGDEPPGRWHGAGARELGLAGSVDDDDFLAVMDGLDPATDKLLGTSHTDRTVRGFDITCSAPKSVSLLFAIGDHDLQDEVLAAHDAAVDATLGWVEAHAHCRYRVNGEVWTVDARGLIAASFRQHTSRAHDPQVHTHLVIANRVRAPDGRWLALDARTLKCDQRTISALYAAGLRAELTARIGVRWREVKNGLAEMADAPDDILRAFSERTRQMEQRIEEKTESFVSALGRLPTGRERWRLERQAVLDSRPTKTSADAPALRQRWLTQLHDLGTDRKQLVDRIIGRSRALEPDDTLDRKVTADALSSLRDTQSVWRPAEVVREIAANLPTRLGATAGEVVDRCERLASQAEDTALVDISRPVPTGVPLRRDGRPVTEGALDRILTTDAILTEEERILDLAQRWERKGGSDHHDLHTDEQLTAVQHHAAAAVAGDRRLVLVVGPAGTGKTAAMRPGVDQLRAEGRPCFGVTPSAAAAEVLSVDSGVDADTLDKLLIEHRLQRPPGRRYDLPSGTTVIVDEAAMVATPRLAELIELAERRGWRLALVGDPLQFSAVGRSGMFGHLVDTIGAVELDRVHRFDAGWERDASLGLRRGDTKAVDLYDKHDRLHGGTRNGMARATVVAWRYATVNGATAAMMAPTNEGVTVLNTLAQAMRMGAGEIDADSASVRLGHTRAYAGDVIATRRNDRTLRTDRRRMVKNRDHWTIEAVHPDGRLTVTGTTGRVTLPADYVARDVTLAYAETSHATQGRTVDRSFLYLDGPTDTRGIYVPLTRGRSTNEAFVVLHGEETAAEIVADAVARTRADQPAIARRLDRPTAKDRPIAASGPSRITDPPRPTRAAPLPERQLRALVGRAVAQQGTVATLAYDLDSHTRTITDLARQRWETTDAISAAQRRLTEATQYRNDHDRPFHRRSHRPEINQARVDVRSLPGYIERLGVELRDLTDAVEHERTARAVTEQRGSDRSIRADADRIRGAIDADARTRGEAAAAHPSPLLVAQLGPVPTDTEARGRWVEAAGRIAQHHALWPVPEGHLLGTRPRLVGQDEYAHTYRAVQQAVADLDSALGRRPNIPGRQAPGLSR